MKHVKSLSTLALIATLGITLSACGGSPSATATSPSVEPIADSTATATAPAAPEAKKSPRGNLIKALGQPAGQSDSITKKQTVNFIINSITVDPPCTGPYPQPSEKGHFVVLDASIETLPELAEAGYPKFDLSPHGFQFVGANGTTYNGNLTSGASYGCLPEGEVLPINGVGPAEKVTGKIVLDVPEATGTLVFKSMGELSGWEWNF